MRFNHRLPSIEALEPRQLFAGAASKLVFVQQPTGGVPGTPVSPGFVIDVEDAGGNFVSSDTSLVTLSIAAGPPGATVNGGSAVNAVGGVATFNSVLLPVAGFYTLRATDGSLASVVSGVFNIPLPALKLVFVQQPGTSTLGSPVSPAVVVDVEDQFGNIATSNESFVTLSIASGPTGALLGGNVTVNADNGVATFTNLLPSQLGAYSLLATNVGVAPVTSAPFQVVNSIGTQSTTTQISSSENPAMVGDTVSFTATVAGLGATPTGNVEFFDGTAFLGLQTLANGTATLAVPNLSQGNHSIFATYTGDANFTSSSSVPVAQVVSGSISDTAPDLLATVGNGQPLAFVPGNIGSTSITITNQGMELAKGVVGVQLFASSDGLLADSIPLTTKILQVAILLKTETYKKITVSFTVPSDLAPGTYALLAEITPISGITSANISSVPLAQLAHAAFSLSFGTVGGRHGITLVQTATDGTIATYRLSGPGIGTLVGASGATPSLVLTGTTAGTVVSITARGGSGTTMLAGLSANSNVGIINAPKTALTGVLDIAGSIRQLVLLSATNSNLAASNFGSVIIEGTVTQSNILAGTSFGADGAPGGGDDTFAAGKITSLRVLGNVTSSIIAAGLNPVDGIYLNGNDTLIAGGQIIVISVAGTVSADSHILAAKLPRNAVINHVFVATASDPRFAL